MSRIIPSLFLAVICVFSSNAGFTQAKKVLIFSKTSGYHHNSIPEGIKAIQKLGSEHKFGVDTTTDANKINSLNLASYAAVVFLNTTGDIFNAEQQQTFEKYIQGGRGFVGIHAAADTEYGWPWYGRLVGAYFISHPKIQDAAVTIVNHKTISTSHLPDIWKTKDEWYNFKEIAPDLKILMNLDEKSYQGGKNGSNHPIAWYHDYEGGRAFYTGLGHVNEAYSDSLYLKHLLGGILYAIGDKKMGE